MKIFIDGQPLQTKKIPSELLNDILREMRDMQAVNGQADRPEKAGTKQKKPGLALRKSP